LSILINAKGEIALYNVITSIVGILIIPISFFYLEKGFQPQVVYIIGLILSVAILIINIIFIQTKVKVSCLTYISNVIFPLGFVSIISVVLPALIYILLEEGIIRLILIVFASVLSVGLSGYFVGLNKTEQAFVIALFNNIKNKLYYRKIGIKG
jgi:hypothetical protein